MAGESVKAVVRIRPLVKSEEDRGCQESISVPAPNQIQIKNVERGFTFDHVFGPEVDQDKVYESAVQDMVQRIFKGYNVTILAYGQTGSGKTFTMGTNYSGQTSMGIIPRAVNEIFDTVKNQTEWTYKITVSFTELYNEQLYDLLAEKPRKNCVVDIREDTNKEIKIVGVTEASVTNAQQTLQFLEHGSSGRATGATAMNDQSSRSHAIFTISIYQQKIGDLKTATTSKFHLVDLAGSERSKKTGATGDRFKEGVNINKGLLALGNVISQLSENGHNFVAYRDSKLTRLLQDSLGGNSMTLLIACVSPADYNLEETMSTLRYADRAKRIKNKPVVNQDSQTRIINDLRNEVQSLRMALMNNSGGSCPPEHMELLEKNRELQSKLRKLTDKFDIQVSEAMCANERAELTDKIKEKLHDELNQTMIEFDEILNTADLQEESRTKFQAIYDRTVNLLRQNKRQEAEITYQSDKNSLEIFKSSSSMSEQSLIDESIGEERSEMDNEITEHTLRQAERNTEIQSINRKLALKEELVTKLKDKISLVEEQQKEMMEMETELAQLHMEKEQLEKALEAEHSRNVSAKLAETRRKKVQDLEKKISDLTRKCTEQSRIIKSKEKSDQQVKNLVAEIHNMKQTRVQLVRQMRKEAEKFTQWKQQRERELLKLKDQDRKRQNEMIRMQAQHSKQQNVLKRKVQEACAVNKRLKEAMDVAKRAGGKQRSSKVDIQAWVDEEFDISMSTAQAKSLLEVQKQERDALMQHVEDLREQNNANPTHQLQTELINQREILEEREANISELQQKILEADDQSRANLRWQSLPLPPEAKGALKRVLVLSAELEKKSVKQSQEYNDLLDKFDKVSNEMLAMKYREQAKSNGKMKSLSNKQAKKRFLEPADAQYVGFLDATSDEDIADDDDVEKDPDYRNTPMYKRLRSAIGSKENLKPTNIRSRKTRSAYNGKCSCESSRCSTLLCGCKHNNLICNSACSCKADSEFCENSNALNATIVKYFPDKTNNL